MILEYFNLRVLLPGGCKFFFLKKSQSKDTHKFSTSGYCNLEVEKFPRNDTRKFLNFWVPLPGIALKKHYFHEYLREHKKTWENVLGFRARFRMTAKRLQTAIGWQIVQNWLMDC